MNITLTNIKPWGAELLGNINNTKRKYNLYSIYTQQFGFYTLMKSAFFLIIRSMKSASNLKTSSKDFKQRRFDSFEYHHGSIRGEKPRIR
jgi:hypothetical protein